MVERAILKPSEIAAQLGLSTGRVYQMIDQGIIPATRVGRALRVPRAAWEAWLDEQQRSAVASARQRKAAKAALSRQARR